MIDTMMLDRISHASAAAPESSCRRQLSSNKTKTKKSGNLRRKRMEIRKMRSLAKDISYGNSSISSDSDDFPHIKCPKKQSVNSDNTDDESSVFENDAESENRRVASHGKISVIGRRREMEDAVAVELDFYERGGKSYDFYGVYDGHGGRRVAEACREMMHKVLVDILGEEYNGGEVINWEKLMGKGFRKMDEEVNKKGAAVATTGSTAVVAVVGEDEVVVANCGDSRAVLCRGATVVQLSDDHKPDRADELERIEECGGKVINWNGQRVLGVLATSRAIGDKYLKSFVITEPEVKVIKRSDSDLFLILASDGLWDVISNEIACQVTRRCLQIKRSSTSNSGASEAASVLAELAMGRGSRDNISVVVVDLKTGSDSHFVVVGSGRANLQLVRYYKYMVV